MLCQYRNNIVPILACLLGAPPPPGYATVCSAEKVKLISVHCTVK